MGKEIKFYRVHKQFTEKDNKEFGMSLINIEFEGKNYVIQISNHAGEKLDYNKNTKEIIKLTKYISSKLMEIK